MEVLLFNIVDPETFNELLREAVFKIVNPETLNVDKIVVLFDVELYALISYTPRNTQTIYNIIHYILV
jgi:hypothetical protein